MSLLAELLNGNETDTTFKLWGEVIQTGRATLRSPSKVNVLDSRNVKIIFGTYLREKCFDSCKAKTVITRVPCCTFCPIQGLSKNAHFWDNRAIVFETVAWQCAETDCVVCTQDAIQSTAVGAYVINADTEGCVMSLLCNTWSPVTNFSSFLSSVLSVSLLT